MGGQQTRELRNRYKDASTSLVASPAPQKCRRGCEGNGARGRCWGRDTANNGLPQGQPLSARMEQGPGQICYTHAHSGIIPSRP